MITLYEYLEMSKGDFDTCDTKYDAEATVCYIDIERDNYDKFCKDIIKKVNVVEINGDVLTVNWSELIERNMDKFKKFTEEHWVLSYEDDIDEFVCQWIKEIHLYMAGYVDEDFYSILVDFTGSLE